MVAPTTIAARLLNDGTLKTIGTFDDTGTTKTGHSITKEHIFADELDELTLNTGTPSGGSIPLNGTSQRIDITGTGDFMFGDGDFTIEGWFILNSTGHTRLWCFPDGDNVEVDNGAMYYWNGSNGVITSGGQTVPQGLWFHVALVKHNLVANVYINGVSVITDNSPYNSTASRPLAIGGEVSGLGNDDNPAVTGWLHGNVTNFRIVKGFAVYTSNFSTAYNPLTTISNTVLLLNAADSGNLLTDSSGKNRSVSNTGGSLTFSSLTPLSTYFNGAMKQLKNGALLLANELDETQTVLS
jgi:Concanavalin A-like lectin/glucanases superfamily